MLHILPHSLMDLPSWTGEKSMKHEEVKEKVQTPRLLKFGAYLAVSNPLGGQLVTEVTKIIQRKLDLIKGVKIN